VGGIKWLNYYRSFGADGQILARKGGLRMAKIKITSKELTRLLKLFEVDPEFEGDTTIRVWKQWYHKTYARRTLLIHKSLIGEAEDLCLQCWIEV